MKKWFSKLRKDKDFEPAAHGSLDIIPSHKADYCVKTAIGSPDACMAALEEGAHKTDETLYYNND